jgi:integrase
LSRPGSLPQHRKGWSAHWFDKRVGLAGSPNRSATNAKCCEYVSLNALIKAVSPAASLYTQKTGTPVYLPLPDFTLEALEQTPVERYFFWRGNGKLKSAVAYWQRILAKVYKAAGVTDAHAHRFHDTFAVELLLSRVTLDQVSFLLGH